MIDALPCVLTGGGIDDEQDRKKASQGNAVRVLGPVAAGAHIITVGDITGEGTISASVPSQTSGETVTVTANPGTGYELTALAYNGTAIDITSTPYTFTMPDADVPTLKLMEEPCMYVG